MIPLFDSIGLKSCIPLQTTGAERSLTLVRDLQREEDEVEGFDLNAS